MMLTDELIDRVLPADLLNAHRELNCMETLNNRMKLNLQLGRIEDAAENLADMVKSMKELLVLSGRAEDRRVMLTTADWLKRVKVIRHV